MHVLADESSSTSRRVKWQERGDGGGRGDPRPGEPAVLAASFPQLALKGIVIGADCIRNLGDLGDLSDNGTS
jgi:hypothetical protein